MAVWPAKTQFSLGICPVWSVFAVCSMSQGPKLSSYGHRRLWSDWVDAQANPSLRWPNMPFRWFCHEAAHFVGILTCILVYGSVKSVHTIFLAQNLPYISQQPLLSKDWLQDGTGSVLRAGVFTVVLCTNEWSEMCMNCLFKCYV